MQAQCTPSQVLIKQAQADKRTTYCTLTSLRNSTPARYHASTHCVWHTALHIAASNALAHRPPDLKLSAGPTLVDPHPGQGGQLQQRQQLHGNSLPTAEGHCHSRSMPVVHVAALPANQPTHRCADGCRDALKSGWHSIPHLSSKTPAQKSCVHPAAPNLTNRDSACSLLA